MVADAAALEACLQGMDATELTGDGLVLEENLRQVTTLSVGRIRVADLLATYHGCQRLTVDNGGAQVYGGSALTVVRGDFDALLATELPEPVRLAVTQARRYDEAAATCFTGFVASRRNYDVAQGVDARGRTGLALAGHGQDVA